MIETLFSCIEYVLILFKDSTLLKYKMEFFCVTPIYGSLESISDHITDTDVKRLDEASPAHCIDP